MSKRHSAAQHSAPRHEPAPAAPAVATEPAPSRLQHFLGIGLKIIFGAILVAVPLAVTPWNYELFEYNKMMLTYGLTVLAVTLWIVQMLSAKRILIRRTPFDIPILLFVASQFVSSIFSMDPHVSWFGYYSRFNGGMWSVLTYVALYYAFVSTVFPPPAAETAAGRDRSGRTLLLFLRLACAGTLPVAVYALAQRMGIDKHIWVQDVQSRVFSTLGQPNWLAAYFLAVLPLTLALLLTYVRSDERFRPKTVLLTVLWGAITTILYFVVLSTRSRSGFIAFLLMYPIFWICMAALGPVRRLHLAVAGAVLSLVLLVITFFNGTNIAQIDRYFSYRGIQQRIEATRQPAPAATQPEAAANGGETAINIGGTESGEIRKYVWQGAINAWQSSTKTRLIGTGTETFAFAFFRYKPKEHNLTSEWDFLYNKAHNEYLNYLATTGIFGLGTYLLLIAAVCTWFIRWQLRQRRELAAHPVLQLSVWALMAGYATILITNFFGFSVVIIQILFFLIPAWVYLLSLTVHGKDSRISLALPLSPVVQRILTVLPVVAGGVLLLTLLRNWQADTAFASGYQLNRLNNPAAAVPYLEEAIRINPGEPLYRDEMGTTLATLAVAIAEQQNATAAGDLAQRAVRQNEIALTVSPENVNFWKSRTKIFYAFSNYDAQYNTFAIQSLERAFSLSPSDPKIAYNLAILYGRAADNAKAIDILKQAIAMKPNYRDAYYALYIFYLEVKQPNLAKTVLEEYLKIDPNDKDFQERLQQL